MCYEFFIRLFNMFINDNTLVCKCKCKYASEGLNSLCDECYLNKTIDDVECGRINDSWRSQRLYR